jgi:hypothetical protein
LLEAYTTEHLEFLVQHTQATIVMTKREIAKLAAGS